MAMLAQLAIALTDLLMKDYGTRLSGEAELCLSCFNRTRPFLGGEGALIRVGVDGQRIERLFRARLICNQRPLPECSVKVVTGCAVQAVQRDIFVLDCIGKMQGEIDRTFARIAFEDHGVRPSAVKQASRTSMISRRIAAIIRMTSSDEA